MRHVDAFVEKPSHELAEQYLATGDYRWNAGMFVVRAATLLELLHTGIPSWPTACGRSRPTSAGCPSSGRRWRRSPSTTPWPNRRPTPAGSRSCRRARTWDDIGDFKALRRDAAGCRTDGPRVLGDPALVQSLDASGLVVPGSGRTVAVIGLQDVVVVDTPDALLVTTADRAQDVKKIVDALKAEGRTDLV